MGGIWGFRHSMCSDGSHEDRPCRNSTPDRGGNLVRRSWNAFRRFRRGRTNAHQISDVAYTLKPGVPELVVTQRFGAPLHISDVSDSPSGKWLIYHSLSSTADLRTSNDMIGFQVLIRSNVVVSWDPVRTHYDKFD